ncbi:MAG: hypothetical protein QM765_48165 [Myxococcales bacterium]
MSDHPSPNPSPSPSPGSEGHTEQDRPNTAFIFVFVLASVIVLLGVVLAVDQFFKVSVLEEIDSKVNSVENPVLRQLRADEETKLTRYQWVDQKNGVLRIPLESRPGARPRGVDGPSRRLRDPSARRRPCDCACDVARACDTARRQAS